MREYPPQPSCIDAYADIYRSTVKLPTGHVVDVEVEGDPPPAAPCAGRPVTLWKIPS